MHDIYSIEDLKQLIFELKQVNPDAPVNVKLVAGANIGTIAVGVAKAGADVIHISGTDGGTGAASLSSMKHAGLPFEFGLIEVHHALLDNNLRSSIKLRTDGGLHTGKDIVMAAMMGADEFDFGRLLLVAEGCVMARICEKNTCPVGIATHNPRFKAKYKGTKDHVVTMLKYIAQDVRRHLATIGLQSIEDVIGRTDLLTIADKHRELVSSRRLDLSAILRESRTIDRTDTYHPFSEGISPMNQQIVDDSLEAIKSNTSVLLEYDISTADRAATATLSGILALRESKHLTALLKGTANETTPEPYHATINIHFKGSAGQGFGAFLTDHIHLRLEGEANDSVCKTMHGGKSVIVPSIQSRFNPSENVIIGNCALYGATGGTMYVNGQAGDRFAVRNSGATAVVEGAGLHACEYMTNGTVVILGKTDGNIGSGMTGGTLFTLDCRDSHINPDYITKVAISEEDIDYLHDLLKDYVRETNSRTVSALLADWEGKNLRFCKYIPVNIAQAIAEEKEEEAETEVVKVD